MNDRPIGVFDSGIGGLTVAKEIMKLLPNESIIYLGDTARVPYGSRSKEVILTFAKELVNFLLEKKVKCLVIACNTISATCFEEIKKMSPVPVIGVVDPAVKKAVSVTKNKKIGVIGTNGTINSKAYENKIHSLDSVIEVISVGCPLFVPLAEEGLSTHKAAKSIAEDYLNHIRKSNVDTLILGCTHYPLLMETIRGAVGEDVVLIDSAEPTAGALKKLLDVEGLISDNTKSTLQVYVTDAPEKVIEVASRFFGEKLNGSLKKITLPTL